MDQDLLRKTINDVNDRFCIFTKGVLSGLCACSRANRICIAEREDIRCDDEKAHLRCIRLLDLLRHHGRFTLKATQDVAPLPHTKSMQLQIGGLRGVSAAVDEDGVPAEFIRDVHTLLDRAEHHFGDLDTLPFQEIVKHIAAYHPRKRR